MAKKNINFEVYERANSASTIDWGKQAQDITKTFTDIRDDRQRRKDEIEKSYQEQQELLANQDLYNNYTLNQLVMNAAQDGSHKLQDQYELVKQGLVKPADLKRFQMNQKTGFTQLKKNAENFDKAFKNYTNRQNEKLNATSSVSKGSPLEAYSAELLSGFANINNMVLETDAVTGNLGLIKLDKDGNPIAGKSSSVNGVSNLMNQQINNFDANQEAQKVKKSFGNIITTEIRRQFGDDVVITEEQRSRAETEYFATKKGKDYLDLQVKIFTEDPTNRGNMMLNAGLATSSGDPYKYGSQEDYDKYAQENPGKENPIIVAEVNDINVMMPKFDEKQKKAAENYATDLIQSTLDVKQTKKFVQDRPKSAAEIAKGDKDQELKTVGDNLNLFVTGSQSEAAGASNYILKDVNNRLSKDQPRLEIFERKTKKATQDDVDAGRAESVDEIIIDKFIVKKKGFTAESIEAYDANGNLRPTQDVFRDLYQEAGIQGNVDAYLEIGGKVNKSFGTSDAGAEAPQEEIKMTLPTDTVVTPAGKLNYEQFFKSDAGGNLQTNLDRTFDSPKKIEQGFKNLLESTGFIPQELKRRIFEDKGNISALMDGNKLTVTIGGTQIVFSDVYGDGIGTESMVDGVKTYTQGGTTPIIAQRIFDAIREETQRVNKGTGNQGELDT